MKTKEQIEQLAENHYSQITLSQKSAVIKSVCPKCKSDDWDSIGKNCRCNKCNKRWEQTN